MTIIGTHCHFNIYGLILTLSKYLLVLFMHLNFVFYVPEVDHIVGRNALPCVYKKMSINSCAFVGTITVYIGIIRKDYGWYIRLRYSLRHFDVSLTVSLSIIFVINQLNAQNLVL